MSDTPQMARLHTVQSEKLEYRIYFAMIWPFAVLAIIARRLTPGGKSWKVSARQSIMAQANEMTGMALPWVFSGR